MDVNGGSSSSSWNDVVLQLKNIRRDDQEFVDLGPQSERNLVRGIVAKLYVRYIVISNQLTMYHDSIVQHQLRILIKRMLMCIHGRVLELKQILIDEDLSIYTPVTQELADFKLTYDQFELRIPRCFRNERRSFLENVDMKIDEVHNQVETAVEEEFEINEQITLERPISETSSTEALDSDLNAVKFMNKQQMPLKLQQVTQEDIQRELAIKFIQKHIRAANDRKFVNELLFARRTREKIISGEYINPSPEETHSAVIKIQRYWRLYRIMKYAKIRTQKKKIVIGMHMSSERPNTDVFIYVDDTMLEKQAKASIDFWEVIKKLQNKLNRYNRYEIKEDIEDELRAYIWTYFEICKQLPSWPDSKPIIFKEDDEFGMPPIIPTETILKQLKIPKKYYQSVMNQRVPLGGSAIFHTGRWMTIEMAKILATLIQEFDKKPAKEKNQLIKDLAATKKKVNDRKDKIQNRINEIKEKARAKGYFIPEPSELTEWFKEILYEYDSDWLTYDKSDQQRLREDLIKIEMFADAQIKVRSEVDETMKEELIKLKIAYAQDMKKKYKPPKKKSKKHVKSKVIKSQNLSPEMMFEELVKNDMIKKSVFYEFNEFKGEVSYSAVVLRGEPHFSDPPYGLGDVVQIIKEFCVIGLNYPELRTLKKIKFVKSFLISGPIKSGKTMLTNAICTETGSLKIQLNLQNVSVNCRDTQSIKSFVNNIVSFVQVYQPVVIEVDMADVPFYTRKNIPSNLKQFKPSLMGKVLLKLLKSFKSTERVIIVGKATCPWLTENEKFINVFDTVVFTVLDYNSMFLLLQQSLMCYPMVSRTFPVTLLANMLTGYPRQVIIDILASVFHNERVLTLRYVPLELKEFIPVMMRFSKNPKLRDQFYNWYQKFVPLGILRTLKLVQKKAVQKKKN